MQEAHSILHFRKFRPPPLSKASRTFHVSCFCSGQPHSGVLLPFFVNFFSLVESPQSLALRLKVVWAGAPKRKVAGARNTSNTTLSATVLSLLNPTQSELNM